MPDAPRLSLLYDVWTLGNLTARVMAADLSPLGLSPSDYALYSLLAARGAQTPSELARASGSPPQSLTYAIRRAENRGHVTRGENLADRRSYTVMLSADGARVHREAASIFHRTMEQVEAELGARASLVKSAFDVLLDALERVDGRQSGIDREPCSSGASVQG